MKEFGGPLTRRRRKPPDPEFAKFMSDDERLDAELEATKAIALADAGFPLRNVNSFEKKGIFTLGDLAEQDRDTLMAIDNVGEKTLDECAKRLDHRGVPHPCWAPPPRHKKKR